MITRRLVSPAEIHEARTNWLWQDRIPIGAVTTLDGDPGSGKSTIICDLAARLTIGYPMPDCDEPVSAAGAVLFQAEDSLSTTVLPNLRAAGADLNKIRLFDRSRFVDQPFFLPDDLPLVEAAVREVHAKLVVIDPLTAFLTGNVNSDTSVRKTLGPLAMFAERHDLAVVVVRHLSKAGMKNPLYGGGGSIGIIAAARAGLVVGRDPDSDEKHRHVLAQSKGNLSDATSLCYRTVRNTDSTVKIEWLGPSKRTAADLAATTNVADEHSALAEARYVLYSVLSDGQVRANKVICQAKQAGISERTLKRAKRELAVRSRKYGSGTGSEWFWELPDDRRELRPLMDQDIDHLMNELIYPRELEPQRANDQDDRHRDRKRKQDDGSEDCPTGS